MKSGDRGWFPSSVTLRERWAEVVRLHPDRIAVRVGEETMTYAAMAAEVDRWVRALEGCLGGEARGVGVLGEPSVAVVVVQFAVLLSGHFHFYLDSRLEGGVGRGALESARLVVLVDCRRDPGDGEVAVGMGWSGPMVRWEEPERLRELRVASGQVESGAGAGALFLTSGSSGVPKMVLFPVEALVADIARQTETLGLGREDVFDLLFSPSFSASLASIYDALLNGATLCVADLKTMGVDRLRAWLERNEVTVCTIGVGTLRAWLRTWSGALPLPRLRLVSTGGEILYWQDVARFRECLGRECRLQNAYASTETRTSAEYFIDGAQALEVGPVPVGRAVRGRRLRLLEVGEAEGRREGELVVDCELGPTAYFNGVDAGAFEALPDGWIRFRTRDWARFDDEGRVHILGRVDDVIKLRGQRVALGEVVQAFHTVHPGIEACVEFVDGELVLVVPGEPGSAERLSEGGILASFADRLRPHRVLFPSALPRTHTGKPDRPELRRWIEKVLRSGRETVDPSTVAGRVARVYRDVTGRVKVSPGAHLFRELGLDSLRAAELLVGLEKEFGRRLPEGLLVDHPTLEGVVAWLEDPAHEPRFRWTVRKAGGKRRLVFVGPKPAHPGLVTALIPLLGPEWEVITLDFPVFRLPREEWVSLGDLSASLAEVVLGQEDGLPVWLAGHCLGGLVAYGVGAELGRRGRPVERLLLLSTSTYAKRRTRLDRLVSMVFRVRWRHLVGLMGKQGLQKIARRVRARVDLPLPADTTAAVGGDIGVDEVTLLDPGLAHLMIDYVPSRFAGRVTLLNPGVADPAREEESNFVLEDGWERFVTGTVDRHRVPGATHLSMQSEQVSATAAVMARLMDSGA
jgi:acyl-coenzyme A synthetase/AMP-(fatty) acid ligase/thioesterase domain-containing protein/acyl carrier protein